MLSKTHTIEAILDLNPTADPSFLAEFPPTDLTQYLFRLVDANDTAHDGSDSESVTDAREFPRRATV